MEDSPRAALRALREEERGAYRGGRMIDSGEEGPRIIDNEAERGGAEGRG